MLIVGHQEGVDTRVVQFGLNEEDADWKMVIKAGEPTAGRHIYLEPGQRAEISFGKKRVSITRTSNKEVYQIDLQDGVGPDDVRSSRVNMFEGKKVDHNDFYDGTRRIGYIDADKIVLTS